MKTLLLIILLFILHISINAQGFQLEWQFDSPTNLIYVGDIDGDNVGEFCVSVFDTTIFYDALTHNIDFTVSGYGNLATYLISYSDYIHLDYNQNGVKDYYFKKNDNIYLIDPSTLQIIFQFNSCSGCDPLMNTLADFDNDGIIELIIEEVNFYSPNNIVYKHYIYSTGVPVSSVEEPGNFKSSEFKLHNNFPNPFNPLTTIRYSISSPEKVSIKIYDISGQLVQEINEEHNQAGEYEVIWDGRNNFGEIVSSGAYFYQIVADNYVEAKKMILLR
jgi:hypothetical protein